MVNEADISEFLSAISPSDHWLPVRIGRGVIVAYNSTTKQASVTIAGGSVPVPGILSFSHYTPVVGDDVHILSIGGDKMIWGKLNRP